MNKYKDEMLMPVTAEQLPVYANVIRRSFDTVATDFGLTYENCPYHPSFITEDQLADKIKDGYYPFGYYSNGEMIGFVSLTDTGGGVFEMNKVCILPEHRHGGRGKKLLDFCKETVVKMGGAKIKIDLMENNIVLKNWYAANGFVHSGTVYYEKINLLVGLMEWRIPMNFVNPPHTAPENIFHKTFYSSLIGCEVGYCVYLPPGYKNGRRYPVNYHLHGYTGHESSEIWALHKMCASRGAINIFTNGTSTNFAYCNIAAPVEDMIITELIPHIDAVYNTLPDRNNRSISGFSMGGNVAFVYAVKYLKLFSSVTAYAATFHHSIHSSYGVVHTPAEQAAKIFAQMMSEEKYLDKENKVLMYLIKSQAGEIKNNLTIDVRIGSEEIILCENEIMHMYLDSLDIPHKYTVVKGAGHELEKIAFVSENT
ncbi:MAG: GNAT family N-acetyltransferase [Defluviitaleaceae bacterium]|nr:GNAT family N-acetyltransferase [Defluviitaleaceae bacterium]